MADSSLAPPRIRLSIARGATRVPPGEALTARIHDENGIWIEGVSTASTIRLDFDGREPLDVTALYQSAAGSDTSGMLVVPIPDLAAGEHRATLAASDNLGNTAAATLAFEVVLEPVFRLAEVIAAPNPVRAAVQVGFVLDVEADIELRIFSVAGREVTQVRQHHDGRRRGLIAWDGKGTGGRAVANGVYLYTLRSRPAGGGTPAEERSGKLVVLRR